MTRQELEQETNPEVLRTVALSLVDENDALLKRISELVVELAATRNQDKQAALEGEIRILHERLDARNKDLYGQRSERRKRPAPAQEPAQDEAKADPAQGTDNAEEQKKQRTSSGRTKQPELAVRTEVHELPEGSCTCSKCHKTLEELKGQMEDSEEISTIARTFYLLHHRRKKYRCKNCGHIMTAPGPTKLVEGGRYSIDFAVEVACDKYGDHLPLERQMHRMASAGLTVTTATLWDQLHQLYLRLLSSYLALRKYILGSDLVHADETTWRLMRKGITKKWWVWLVRDESAVYYMIEPTRGNAAAQTLLGDYDGIVMSDAYTSYRSLEKARDKAIAAGVPPEKAKNLPNFTSATCWMHARRPLFEAEKNYEAATTALDLIAELYAIEARATKAVSETLDLVAAREQFRNAESRAVIARLQTWVNQTRSLPKSQLYQGIQYMRNNWVSLTLFLDDGRIPLDNGAAERSARGPVLGRKNHYGSRSEAGTRVAALFYSLVETCKNLGINPRLYLKTAALRAIQNPGTITLPHDLLPGGTLHAPGPAP